MAGKAEGDRAKRRVLLCPQCGGTTHWEGNPHRPFCSERCRLIDLGAWAEEKYRVPAEDIPPGGEEEP
ncbi:MAG: DNA gyrase inhibitor YacG [bacterium]